MKGRITRGVGGFYYVKTEKGVFECRAKGIFRKNKITPLVGDLVEIQILDDVNYKGNVEKIYPRKNELIRPKVANVDQAIIVCAAKKPDINVHMLDRFVILAAEVGVDVVLCINKIDLDPREEYKNIAIAYEKAGYQVLAISAKQHNGQAFMDLLKGKVSVLAGPSGVGKSSMINLLGQNIMQKTGALSEKIQRGKHTTRQAELLEVDEQCYVIDSPGFTSLYIHHIQKEDLKEYYPEFVRLEDQCRFQGCNHISEPGCAVKEAVGDTIDLGRYERYLEFYQELKQEGNR